MANTLWGQEGGLRVSMFGPGLTAVSLDDVRGTVIEVVDTLVMPADTLAGGQRHWSWKLSPRSASFLWRPEFDAFVVDIPAIDRLTGSRLFGDTAAIVTGDLDIVDVLGRATIEGFRRRFGGAAKGATILEGTWMALPGGEPAPCSVCLRTLSHAPDCPMGSGG